MRILECDLGNTRCKWRLLREGRIVDRGVFTHQQYNGVESAGWIDRVGALDRIRLVSVAKGVIQDGFLEMLSAFGVSPEIAETSHAVAGVRCAYTEPSRLGTDRWLGVVAGYHYQQGAALILDVGTALKADMVDDTGHHLGGYIVPGKEMMKASLLNETGRVRFVDGDYTGGLLFGCDTGDAVNAGVLASQVGAVLIAIAEARRRIPEEFAILLAGGDGPALLQYLSADQYQRITLLPDLVLDGLQWVLP